MTRRLRLSPFPLKTTSITEAVLSGTESVASLTIDVEGAESDVVVDGMADAVALTSVSVTADGLNSTWIWTRLPLLATPRKAPQSSIKVVQPLTAQISTRLQLVTPLKVISIPKVMLCPLRCQRTALVPRSRLQRSLQMAITWAPWRFPPQMVRRLILTMGTKLTKS